MYVNPKFNLQCHSVKCSDFIGLPFRSDIFSVRGNLLNQTSINISSRSKCSNFIELFLRVLNYEHDIMTIMVIHYTYEFSLQVDK